MHGFGKLSVRDGECSVATPRSDVGIDMMWVVLEMVVDQRAETRVCVRVEIETGRDPDHGDLGEERDLGQRLGYVDRERRIARGLGENDPAVWPSFVNTPTPRIADIITITNSSA
jgi:hypothetical protein